MANAFGGDILLQAPRSVAAARFYVEQLGFAIDAQTPELISLHGPSVNLFIERGPGARPDPGGDGRRRGGPPSAGWPPGAAEIVKDEPEFPRCYVRDPSG